MPTFSDEYMFTVPPGGRINYTANEEVIRDGYGNAIGRINNGITASVTIPAGEMSEFIGNLNAIVSDKLKELDERLEKIEQLLSSKLWSEITKDMNEEIEGVEP